MSGRGSLQSSPQANASCTMPVSSVEFRIGSLLVSIIKNNFLGGLDSRYICSICSIYVVYMPNICMKVADIYAIYMLYVCCIVHACILHTSCVLWHVSIYVYAAHMKKVLIPEINLPVIKQFSWHSLVNNTATLR